jgi:two-component system, chemotaxis family, chemotaxis protein CheY
MPTRPRPTTTIDPQALRILLIDDMPAMRSVVRSMLVEQGFANITETEDGELAWRLIQDAAMSESAFGLIISDWQMPGMTGVDLLRAVRSSSFARELPFFLITAKGDEPHVREALQAGVTDYIVKPFTGEQLAEKVRGLFT